MIDNELLDEINRNLKREFGYGPDNINPAWRVVLAGDQLERRLVSHTSEGFKLIHPEVREVRKYQHIERHKYVLEKQVPVTGETDLVAQLSYEPIWTFEDRHGNYLPPRYDACQLIIDISSSKRQSAVFKKYDDPNTSQEAKFKQLQETEELLFGNETPTTDALAYGYGVAGFHKKEAI